jgi:hypothetical protein
MGMRFVPTYVHGIVDHVTSAALVAVPALLRLDGAAGAVPRANGVVAAIYSNLTDYELSAKNVISMRTHLALDGASGAFLVGSPWLLGFGRRGGVKNWLPHTLVGATEIFFSLTTVQEPPRTKLGRLARLRNALPV